MRHKMELLRKLLNRAQKEKYRTGHNQNELERRESCSDNAPNAVEWRKGMRTTPIICSVKHPFTGHQHKAEKQGVKFVHVSQQMLFLQFLSFFLARVLYFLTVPDSLSERLLQSATEDIFPSAQMQFISIQFGSSSLDHLTASPFFGF